ncbi:MAG: 16S rRNA (cytidine(1402)-2'-O)-methyltransferase [Bacteroidia bacterium]|nr:16S rRNA (cytidine(1402)-2'-O)-methyltransferase [Bacteroidia bacterium]
MSGILVIVGTPIGHAEDISPRAVTALRDADLIACEEAPVARRLLSRHGMLKDLIEVNEHTERDAAEEVLEELRGGKTVALISDCGMPVFADPGSSLVSAALDAGIVVDVVPGPDSLTAALAVSGFNAQRFLFYGFLSPKKSLRRDELAKLRSMTIPLVFLDAPYRLTQVLEDMRTQLGPTREACIACDLTLPSQLVARGTLHALYTRFAAEGKKREFVIIVGPRPESENRSASRLSRKHGERGRR